MGTIHSTACVDKKTVLSDDFEIGPFAVLGVDGAASPLRLGDRAIIRSHAVIYSGTSIGEDFHAGHGCLVRENVVIGDRVSIGSHSIVEHDVRIASNVRLHSGVFIPEYSELEEGCWLGPGVIVTNARFPNTPATKDNLEGVRIQAGAVVGAGVVLLPGITVGHGSLVGAGAVVVKDVENDAVMVGNPARRIR
jgi:acetyltransferase-like isoleucine patch superfamily enzyme